MKSEKTPYYETQNTDLSPETKEIIKERQERLKEVILWIEDYKNDLSKMQTLIEKAEADPGNNPPSLLENMRATFQESTKTLEEAQCFKAKLEEQIKTLTKLDQKSSEALKSFKSDVVN